MGEWLLSGQGLVSFFFLSLFLCLNVHVCTCSCARACVCTMAHTWRSEVNLIYWSAPSILFEARSILFATVVCPPGWLSCELRKDSPVSASHPCSVLATWPPWSAGPGALCVSVLTPLVLVPRGCHGCLYIPPTLPLFHEDTQASV